MTELAGIPAILYCTPCPCVEVAAAAADEVDAPAAGVVAAPAADDVGAPAADDVDDKRFQLPLESSLLVRRKRTRGRSPPSSSSVAIPTDRVS